MSNTIDFGIDLGTTNSVIAKYHLGKVEIFKNPIGHKETLPSVVAFRKERIIVGDKAKEFLEKDPENVVGSFKRKMGTSESFFIENTSDFKNPVDLSALVLKELKNFVYTGEPVEAVVITIPASFDTIQSNATKKAGYEAGFSEVLLLQEPIAASLAYANKDDGEKDKEGRWLVYDLGGGTFDVALVKIGDGEMNVVDHQGNNFLGGLDFDNRIIDNIIVPHLEKMNQFDNVIHELKSAKGKYNRLYYELLNKSEEIKVELTGSTVAELEFEIENRDGVKIEILLSITRVQFENSILDLVESSLEMIKIILDRNNLSSSDLRYVLMIGGSTYIPLVRKLVADRFGIAINCTIDPTTAVAIGAAYYAGSRSRAPIKKENDQTPNALQGKSPVTIRTAYQKTCQEKEEYFAASVEGVLTGLFYRITRDDGGFDSGLKKLETRISEMLPLVTNFANLFSLKIYDEKNNSVPVDVPAIMIMQGKFNVLGQPLPHDICIEVDDYENNTTRLEIIFEKNALLPLKKTITKNITKTIRKGSTDNIIINVLEGPHISNPSTNSSIGIIRVLGTDLTRDLLKGTDIEITLEISESRDLRITTYLLMTDQEFSNLFSPSERHVDIARLREEIQNISTTIKREIRDAEKREDYDVARKLHVISENISLLQSEIDFTTADDITDRKYQVEDKKRELAREADRLTRDKHTVEAMQEYFDEKGFCANVVKEHGTDSEKKKFDEIVAKEKNLMASNSPQKVKGVLSELRNIYGPIRWRIPEHVISIFHHYAYYKRYPDQQKANEIVERGEKAMERKNYEELRTIINQLFNMLPPDEKKIDMIGTGIG